jgi:hypothetical protein
MITADTLTEDMIHGLLADAARQRDITLIAACSEALGIGAVRPQDRELRMRGGRELCAAELNRRAGYRSPLYGVSP